MPRTALSVDPAVHVLKWTREFFGQGAHKWIKKSSYGVIDASCEPTDPNRYACCVSGALGLAGDTLRAGGWGNASLRLGVSIRATQALQLASGTRLTVPAFNDHPARTYHGILDWLDRAIALAEEGIQ